MLFRFSDDWSNVHQQFETKWWIFVFFETISTYKKFYYSTIEHSCFSPLVGFLEIKKQAKKTTQKNNRTNLHLTFLFLFSAKYVREKCTIILPLDWCSRQVQTAQVRHSQIERDTFTSSTFFNLCANFPANLEKWLSMIQSPRSNRVKGPHKPSWQRARRANFIHFTLFRLMETHVWRAQILFRASNFTISVQGRHTYSCCFPTSIYTHDHHHNRSTVAQPIISN